MKQAVEFSVSRWAAWAPGLQTAADWRAWVLGERAMGEETETPDVKFLPAMLRRRTSRVTRAALWGVYQCAGQAHGRRTVFASRHGELHRSTALLTGLAHDEPLSPNGFSLSVHNTASGLYSIASGNQAPSSALAAGRDTLACGVIEAAGYLQRGEPEVILVISDERPPAFYQSWLDPEPALFALALVLTAPNGKPVWRLTPNAGEAADETRSAMRHELALMSLLAADEARLCLAGEAHTWLWQKV